MKPSSPPSVCVIGLGYIGLPTAAVLARSGCQVHGVDIRGDVVDTINRGQIHIHEPGLGELVAEAVADGRLSASQSPVAADVFMICVPTPITADHAPDLTCVKAASQTVAPLVRRGGLVVLESTSPPGTTEQVVARHAVPPSLRPGRDVFVAYCPERVLPGRILTEVVENDRIVGGVTAACTERARQFFQRFVRGQVLGATAAAAEMTKLAENAFRDVNIAFANELSLLAEHFAVDPLQVIALANRHPRVNILTPGPGVGGHCIGVDPWFLHHADPESTPLIRAARDVNDGRPSHIVRQIAEQAAGLDRAVIGCLGLAYKADVDDLRGSPSLDVVRQLEAAGVGDRRLVCEPYLRGGKFDEFPLAELPQVLRECNVLALLTDHRQFRELPAEALRGKVLIDPRGAWQQQRSAASRRAA